MHRNCRIFNSFRLRRLAAPNATNLNFRVKKCKCYHGFHFFYFYLPKFAWCPPCQKFLDTWSPGTTVLSTGKFGRRIEILNSHNLITNNYVTTIYLLEAFLSDWKFILIEFAYSMIYKPISHIQLSIIHISDSMI